MVSGDAESRRRPLRGNLLVLVGLFAVFAVPILLAYGLNVWWPHWSPFGRLNHGELVEPAWEVELASMDRSVAERVVGRWILLHPVEASCNNQCEAMLELTRRIHISLGKDYDRVVRLFVHRAGVSVEGMQSMDSDLIPVSAPAAWFDRFAGEEPVLVVVDPQRQAVLRYGADLKAKGLARDLARMLKISKIG